MNRRKNGIKKAMEADKDGNLPKDIEKTISQLKEKMNSAN